LLVRTPITTTIADQKNGSSLSAGAVGGLVGGILGILLLIGLGATFYLLGRRKRTKPPKTTTTVTVETPNVRLHEARDRSEEIAEVGGRLRTDRSEEIAEVGGRLRRDRSEDLSTVGGRLRYPTDEVIEGGRLGSSL